VSAVEGMLKMLTDASAKGLRLAVGSPAKMMDASGSPQDASSHPLTRQEILQLVGPIIPEHARRRLPQETTVEFTGPELNLLLQRNSDWDFLRGRTRIDIADSVMTLALSAPLDRLPWPGLKGRWFNGTLRFSMTYTSGEFQLEIISAEANGNQFPSSLLSSFNSSFNDSMNEEFQKELRKNNRESEFWGHIKSIVLQEDKLIISTKAK